MRVDEISKEGCCGCSACASGCPKNAIIMKGDEEGFIYPIIDNQRCIDCGLCMKLCSFNSEKEIPKEFYKVFSLAVRHKDVDIVKQSQSGGAFTALSDGALKNDFFIWGMVYQNDQVICLCATNEEQRNKMRGSKYVQGSIETVFPELENQLIEGKKVLFSGTPCQVSAIKKFAKNRKLSTEHLYTIDLICHGVPRPRFWNDYLTYRKRQLHTESVSVNFRDKTRLGWHSHEESIGKTNSSKKVYSHKYANIFYTHLTLRPSCYKCPFASQERVGDITIADCWGIERNLSAFDDNRGTSLLIINSKKGEELLHFAEKEMLIKEINIKDYLQPNMIAPSNKPNQRDKFWKEYNSKGFKFVLRKYSKDSWKVLIKRCMGLYKNRGLWK